MSDEDTTPELQEASESEGSEVEAHSAEILGLQKLDTGSAPGFSDPVVSCTSCASNSCHTAT
jgi:hypothetical protein